jgi:vacuolar-type H+-ATPase subunit E/Vma4
MTSIVANEHEKLLEKLSEIIDEAYKKQYEYLDGLLEIENKSEREKLLYKYWKLYPESNAINHYVQYLKSKYNDNKVKKFIDLLKSYPRTFKYTLSIDDETYYTIVI